MELKPHLYHTPMYSTCMETLHLMGRIGFFPDKALFQNQEQYLRFLDLFLLEV